MTQTTTLNRQALSAYLEFANELADKARNIALKHFRNPRKQWLKPDQTWVTESDLEIEKMARELVSHRYPDHGYFGEEFENINLSESFKWCIDPIDGTEPYVFGLPTFGVLIALTFNANPVVGVIESPALGQRWSGATGLPTVCGGEHCQTNNNTKLDQSTVFATSIDMFSKKEKEVFNRVSLAAHRRRFGADNYAYGLLASGYIEIVMEADMKPYDMMALVPVINGAGGVVTDWSGKPLNISSGSQILATSNIALHEQCLSLIHKTTN